jgi:urease accessory protein
MRAFPKPEPQVTDAAGWLGQLDLGFEQREGHTLLVHRRRRGPLAVQRPFYPEGGVCHLYLLHPPGIMVGGDRIEIAAQVAEGAHALVTTPGAGKFYRSAGPWAIQDQRLTVRNGAVLEWLPHENILFPGAKVRMRTEVELTGSGRFIGWEIHSLGRPAIGERFVPGTADLGLTVRRDGRPLLHERLRLGAEADLGGPSGLRGYPLCATLIAAGAQAGDLDALRQGLSAPDGGPGALTLVDDLLVVRGLASAVEPLRRYLMAGWDVLRPRLLGRRACPPRIWAT